MKTYPDSTRDVPIVAVLTERKFKIPGLKWTLVLIPILYISVLLIFSLVGIFKLSVVDESGFTLKHFAHFFKQPVYLEVLFITFKTAFYVTMISLLLGYPVAYQLTKIENDQWRNFIMGIILVSFWISLLIRSFVWMIILRSNGVLNNLLMSLGMEEPLNLMYNTTGVVIGMTHILLPYMILSLYSVMQGIDKRLLQAARSLGANPIKAFLQIFLPLSFPGVLSGSLIVFVLGIGYFITPALLGGPENLMISQLIYDQVNVVLNWNFAATISVVLLVFTLILIAVSGLISGKVMFGGAD